MTLSLAQHPIRHIFPTDSGNHRIDVNCWCKPYVITGQTDPWREYLEYPEWVVEHR